MSDEADLMRSAAGAGAVREPNQTAAQAASPERSEGFTIGGEGFSDSASSVPGVEDADCGLAAYQAEPDRFYRDNVLVDDSQCPRRAKERPEHRLMVLLKAQGYSNKEIAERLGYTPTAVGHILRQPWARLRLVEELRAAGRDALDEVLRGAALDSVFTLITERDNGGAKPSERIAAANALLDRFLGKPVAKVEQTITQGPSLADLESAEAELVRLQDEEKRLRAN